MAYRDLDANQQIMAFKRISHSPAFWLHSTAQQFRLVAGARLHGKQTTQPILAKSYITQPDLTKKPVSRGFAKI